MTAPDPVHLADRGIVSVEGADSAKLLQGIVTNDVERLAIGEACLAGLLSPQGKILFEFFVVRMESGFLLDTLASTTADLIKRLSMYKLRAAVTIADASAAHSVFALLGPGTEFDDLPASAISYVDPRDPRMGSRIIAPRQAAPLTAVNDLQFYDARRVELGVPEGGKDYAFADAYPHEAGFDRFHGVSFSKGCYVGQEVVSRMQHKTVVRKRVVRVTGDGSLTSGEDIMLDETVVGKIGTTAGNAGLAMLKLDRALAAAEHGQTLRAGSVTVMPEADAISEYAKSASKNSSEPVRAS